ncbi:MAG: ion transporter, partial [Hydrogenovibrio sp.]|nr:ion transporter [Hydrogenovibrio sp.]
LLTLFRVATFEDWTDVMYETMTVYPLSWIYYLTFIFFSAFVFLNMMIGIVVEVLDEEHKKLIADEEEQKQDEWLEHRQKIERDIAVLNDKLDRLLEKDQKVF